MVSAEPRSPVACPTCGTANSPTVKFCGECGTALTASGPAQLTPPGAAPTAERRLVSVLFADLVGFTTLSESRDPEEVRELLSRYFDTCRRLIELYGGIVEKFIGDAVMAVWGTPTATEDDAERAVRAALDLIAAVSALGDEVGAPELAARAGVLTGEAAVTLGAQGQGMVAGDLVNTAARIQSAADPGTVFVGEATKRSSEASIAYASAGTHALKGKDESVPLWRALRVTAGRGGALKSAGLEPPFVGRDRELRLVKELFHATADEQRAHLVSVTGIAGIGKSRLGWEFFKYMDGLEEGVWWHRGRCLAYGEGVAFWALAEMVRMRAGIVEGEDPASAREKVRTSLDAFVVDDEERRFVEPRILHLLGLEEGPARAKEELFGAWRVFFERMAEQGPRRAPLRGSPVGRLRAGRVRRTPARVVAQPADLRALPRPPGAAEPPSRIRAGLSSDDPLACPPFRAGDDGAARRIRPRTSCGSSRPHPRPLRGRAALRRGDGAHAARSRAPVRGRGRVPADGRGGRARRPRDPSRTHRRPSRRAVRRGAAPPPGRVGARQDLHEGVTRRAVGLVRGGPGSAPRGSRAQGGARCPGRPALAGARPVRVPPGPRSACRLRDARPAGP